ncbi:MAG: hypothetical protein MI919_40315, partial [Holophagales bacterium]|nr:hypothetical protein [Holophagales bacterium]
GLLLITAGVLKKTTADLLAIPAQKAFDSGASVSLIETWTGVLAFAGQIYGDFAGYTDMAIGLALLLGFKIPLNFRVPYFAVSPVDFWRRWHISLSTWLRDYLYISLGGNRGGNRWRNVMITMLLGGLWHGAAWTFVVWGAFHGALIAATHALGRLPFAGRIAGSKKRLESPEVEEISVGSDGAADPGDGDAPRQAEGRGAGDAESEAGRFSPRRLLAVAATFSKWAVTFYLVLLGWVLFRAESLGSAMAILADMHGLGGVLPSAASKAPTILLLTVATLLLMHLMDLFILHKAEWLEGKAWLFWPILLLIQTLCLFLGEPSNEFIYFQF